MKLTPKQLKYLASKADIINANIAGVGAAGYMLGNMGQNWNNAARDAAFKEVDKVLKQIAVYFTNQEQI